MGARVPPQLFSTDAAGIDLVPDGRAREQTGRHAAAITVADVLELEALRGAEVVAGHAGLSRVVTGINIIEVPDVWQWLRGGEFLLSAAYAWRDDLEALVGLLTKLDQVGVSALGFKLGRYVEELPPPVLDVADRLGIPVVLLPPDVAYHDVFEPLYRRLLLRPGREFAPTRRVDQALLRFGLDDQSIEKIAGALAVQLRRQVRVVDTLDEVVYFAPPQGLVLKRPFQQLNPETEQLLGVLAHSQARRRVTRVGDGDHGPLATALVVGGRRYGHVLVLGNGDGLAEGEVETPITQAAELISFLLLKRLAFLEGRRQASSLFFESLMSDALTNEEATERALSFGLRLSQPCIVVMIGFLVGGELDTEQWSVLRHHLEHRLRPRPGLVTTDPASSSLRGIFQLQHNDDERLLASILEGLREYVGDGRHSVVAAGSPGVGLQGVRRSRAEALIAFDTGVRLRREGVIQFADLGVERLLAQIPITSVSEGYVKALLGPIEDDEELLRTLELYLQHGGNKSATAAAVPLHRSSLLYRLGKISTRLGVNLDDPEQRHELWLALRLRRVLSRPQ